jgi:uncharacterized membrane protein
VVGIAVPSLQQADDVGQLADALGDLVPDFASFVIGFAVIGRYWFAHHQFFSMLARVDGNLIGLNLIYLMFVAFLPFPTGVLGSYFENPLSVATYAVIVATISGLEVVMFRYAHRHGLLEREMPEDVYRWGALMSAQPVAFFLLSVPVAFLHTGLAVAIWFLGVPFQTLVRRWRPEHADEFYAH